MNMLQVKEYINNGGKFFALYDGVVREVRITRMSIMLHNSVLHFELTYKLAGVEGEKNFTPFPFQRIYVFNTSPTLDGESFELSKDRVYYDAFLRTKGVIRDGLNTGCYFWDGAAPKLGSIDYQLDLLTHNLNIKMHNGKKPYPSEKACREDNIIKVFYFAD